MAHEGAQSVFDMNLPLWEAHGADVLVVGSATDPVKTSHRSLLAGDDSNTSRSYNRWLAMMGECNRIARAGTDMFMFYEYDSVSIAPVIPRTSGMFGIVQYLRSPHNWTATRYANVPWRMDALTVQAIYDKLSSYPLFQENGCNDRLIPAAAQLCGIPLIPFTPAGYGAPGGMVHDHMLDELREEKRRGATMFHGIKTPQALAIVTE